MCDEIAQSSAFAKPKRCAPRADQTRLADEGERSRGQAFKDQELTTRLWMLFHARLVPSPGGPGTITSSMTSRNSAVPISPSRRRIDEVATRAATTAMKQYLELEQHAGLQGHTAAIAQRIGGRATEFQPVWRRIAGARRARRRGRCTRALPGRSSRLQR